MRLAAYIIIIVLSASAACDYCSSSKSDAGVVVRDTSWHGKHYFYGDADSVKIANRRYDALQELDSTVMIGARLKYRDGVLIIDTLSYYYYGGEESDSLSENKLNIYTIRKRKFGE